MTWRDLKEQGRKVIKPVVFYNQFAFSYWFREKPGGGIKPEIRMQVVFVESKKNKGNEGKNNHDKTQGR